MAKNEQNDGNKSPYSREMLVGKCDALVHSEKKPLYDLAKHYHTEVVDFLHALNLSKEKTDAILKDCFGAFAIESLQVSNREQGLHFFYITYHKYLFAYLGKYNTIRREDKEELVQDSFIVLNKIAGSGVLRGNYLSKGTPALAVLYGILKNLIKKYFKENEKQVEVILGDEALQSAPVSDIFLEILVEPTREQIFKNRVGDCFKNGPDYCHELLLALLYYEKSLEDYAKQAILEGPAARQRKKRCYEQLKKCLGLFPDEDSPSDENKKKNTENADDPPLDDTRNDADNDMDTTDDDPIINQKMRAWIRALENSRLQILMNNWLLEEKEETNTENTIKPIVQAEENNRLRGMMDQWTKEEEDMAEEQKKKTIPMFWYWRAAAAIIPLMAAVLFVRPPQSADTLLEDEYDRIESFESPRLKGSNQSSTGQTDENLKEITLLYEGAQLLANKEYELAIEKLQAAHNSLNSSSDREGAQYCLLLAYLGAGRTEDYEQLSDSILNAKPRHLYYNQVSKLKQKGSWRFQIPIFGK